MKNNNKIFEQISLYAKRLSPLRQLEALDFIKWLWGGPISTRDFTDQEIKKIELLMNSKGGRKFRNWYKAKEYLDNLSK